MEVYYNEKNNLDQVLRYCKDSRMAIVNLKIHALEGKDMSFGVGRPDALTLTDVQYDFLSFSKADPRGIDGRKKEHMMDERLRLEFYRGLRSFPR